MVMDMSVATQQNDFMHAVSRQLAGSLNVRRTVRAALHLAAPAVGDDTATWVSELLKARSIPGTPAADLGVALTAVLRDHPLAVGLLREHWDVP
jgi:hypothetical protein